MTFIMRFIDTVEVYTSIDSCGSYLLLPFRVHYKFHRDVCYLAS